MDKIEPNLTIYGYIKPEARDSKHNFVKNFASLFQWAKWPNLGQIWVNIGQKGPFFKFPRNNQFPFRFKKNILETFLVSRRSRLRPKESRPSIRACVRTYVRAFGNIFEHVH